MPDDTTKTDNQAPVQGTPPANQPNPVPPVAPNMDAPPPPIQDGAASPPPPIVEEKKTEKEQPKETKATPDIPPVISTSGSGSKKKPVSKKMIATILGVLVLVGGIGAGVVLVQKQQDIREDARTIADCELDSECGTGYKCIDGYCIAKTPTPAPTRRPGTCDSHSDCNEGQICNSSGYCKTIEPTPEPTPKPAGCKVNTDCGAGEICLTNGKCVKKDEPDPTPASSCSSSSKATAVNDGGGARATQFTVTQAQVDSCNNACPTAWVNVYRYECDSTSVAQGCQDNGTLLKSRAKAGDTFSIGDVDCGSVQIDSGCFDSARAYGNLAFASYVSNANCSSRTTPPGLSCSCLNIKTYDTEWNPITNLSSLVAGDVVRFTVSGKSSSGVIDMARFTINGILGPEVTDKKPGTNEFYTEYTIPEGVTSFTVNAELHHTAIGWF